MPIALDTNVLVRFLVGDDETQAVVAKRLINKHSAGDRSIVLNDVVVCETAWVLESCYDFSTAESIACLEDLLRVSCFDFQSRDEIHAALHDTRAGGIDFTDAFIGRLNEARKCETTFTFDRRLKRSKLFTLL